MTMKKLVCLTLFVLFATVFVSCARATPELPEGMLKPRDKIGNMTVEEHAMSTKYPEIWHYCAFQPEGKEAGTKQLTACTTDFKDGNWLMGRHDTTILDSTGMQGLNCTLMVID
jgi:hypothetical protein